MLRHRLAFTKGPARLRLPLELRHRLILAESHASGDEGIRTLDPLLARQVLSQLSYTPKIGYVFILMSGRLLNSDFAFACLR